MNESGELPSGIEAAEATTPKDDKVKGLEVAQNAIATRIPEGEYNPHQNLLPDLKNITGVKMFDVIAKDGSAGQMIRFDTKNGYNDKGETVVLSLDGGDIRIIDISEEGFREFDIHPDNQISHQIGTDTPEIINKLIDEEFPEKTPIDIGTL